MSESHLACAHVREFDSGRLKAHENRDALFMREDAQDAYFNACVTEPHDGENMQDPCDHDL